ncbi:MAG: hypothetical protein JNJ45_10445 [Chthonomonas sp.]|nr:hypothetical protein [Chthonomonas sp.]
MPLQNRVTPFSRIERSAARGRVIGNRGILHNAAQELECETWRHKAWIACALEFRGWRRPVMSARSWTELFFLDEAVALAAGHRPCAFCRRADYLRFCAAWAAAFGARASAKEMDRVLHAERVPMIRGARPPVDVLGLPDGAFVESAGSAWLVWRGQAHRWSHEGYSGAVDLGALRDARLVTPPSLVAVLRAGYVLAEPPMV